MKFPGDRLSVTLPRRSNYFAQKNHTAPYNLRVVKYHANYPPRTIRHFGALASDRIRAIHCGRLFLREWTSPLALQSAPSRFAPRQEYYGDLIVVARYVASFTSARTRTYQIGAEGPPLLREEVYPWTKLSTWWNEVTLCACMRWLELTLTKAVCGLEL